MEPYTATQCDKKWTNKIIRTLPMQVNGALLSIHSCVQHLLWLLLLSSSMVLLISFIIYIPLYGVRAVRVRHIPIVMKWATHWIGSIVVLSLSFVSHTSQQSSYTFYVVLGPSIHTKSCFYFVSLQIWRTDKPLISISWEVYSLDHQEPLDFSNGLWCWEKT